MGEWENTSVIVDGYAFFDTEDAKLAQAEVKKVEYLRKNLQNAEPEKVLGIYKKAVSDRLFRTPVGTEFLRELQTYLIDQADYPEAEVPAIPLYVDYDQKLRSGSYEVHRRVEKPKEEPKQKVPFIFVSVVLNIVLLLAVIAMFVITLKSDQPNILNYEKALLNRYSYWEQDLTNREQVVREKELELHLENY